MIRAARLSSASASRSACAAVRRTEDVSPSAIYIATENPAVMKNPSARSILFRVPVNVSVAVIEILIEVDRVIPASTNPLTLTHSCVI
jgi:hypothetical protein